MMIVCYNIYIIWPYCEIKLKEEFVLSKIKAWELFKILNEYNYEQLKELDIAIEIDRENKASLGESRYAEGIEEYPSQIRIYSM